MPRGCSLITLVIPTSTVVRYFGLVKSPMSTSTVATLAFYLFGVSFRWRHFAQSTSVPTSCLSKLLVTLNPDKPLKSMFVCTLLEQMAPFANLSLQVPPIKTYKNYRPTKRSTKLYKRINVCLSVLGFVSVEVILFSLHACGGGGGKGGSVLQACIAKAKKTSICILCHLLWFTLNPETL